MMYLIAELDALYREPKILLLTQVLLHLVTVELIEKNVDGHVL